MALNSYRSTNSIVQVDEDTFEIDGVRGSHHISAHGPAYGHDSKRVEVVDGTTPRHQATLNDIEFTLGCRSRSGSTSNSSLAYPEGAVEIEQHIYKGDIIEECYGAVDHDLYDQTIIHEVPVYEKEIEEIVVKETVVNTIVERVPKFNYIDDVVEVEHIVEVPVYKEVPVKKTVIKQVSAPVREQRLIEKVRYVPVTEEVEVERIIEIPGEVIVQPRHVVRDEVIYTDKHHDKEVPVVLSQVVKPVFKDTKKKVRVPAKILNPDLHTATVSVPKPVSLEFHQTEVETKFRHKSLSAADYNSAFFQLNTHLTVEQKQLLTPDKHLYVDSQTGYPLYRDNNIKFYRLPESILTDLPGYNARGTDSKSSKSSSKTSSSSSSTTTSSSSSSSPSSSPSGSQIGSKYISKPVSKQSVSKSQYTHKSGAQTAR